MLKESKKCNRQFTPLSELQYCLIKQLKLKIASSRLKRHTCDRNVTRPKLYRYNKINRDKKLNYLTLLLDGENDVLSETIFKLFSEVLKILYIRKEKTLSSKRNIQH